MTQDNDAPLRLDDAVTKAFPHGGMTAAGLRREAARGRLSIWRIANKDFTSLSAIREMLEKCRVDCSPPSSSSARPKRGEVRSGSYTTSDAATALAAARATVRELKRH